MIRFENSVTIQCHHEDVFVFLANFENEPLWKQHVAEKKKITDGPINTGTKWREKVRGAGPPAVNTFEVITYEPSCKLSYKNASGPFSVLVHYILEALENETKLSIVSEIGLPGLAKPLMAGMYEKSMGGMMVSLKKYLEGNSVRPV